MLKRLDHPNVVTIHQFYRKDPTNFFVVLESLSGGELFDRIVKKVLCASLLDCLVTAWLTCLLACLPTCSLAGCAGGLLHLCFLSLILSRFVFASRVSRNACM